MYLIKENMRIGIDTDTRIGIGKVRSDCLYVFSVCLHRHWTDEIRGESQIWRSRKHRRRGLTWSQKLLSSPIDFFSMRLEVTKRHKSPTPIDNLWVYFNDVRTFLGELHLLHPRASLENNIYTKWGFEIINVLLALKGNWQFKKWIECQGKVGLVDKGFMLYDTQKVSSIMMYRDMWNPCLAHTHA